MYIPGFENMSPEQLKKMQEQMEQEEYEEMLRGRISGILTCTGSMGYQNLILGAFGCVCQCL